MVEITGYGAAATEEETELIRSAVQNTLRSEGRGGDVTVLLTTEEEIRSLNARFRSIDRVTDVLTFPAWEGEALIAPPDGYLGDIAICMKRAAEQAEEYGHSELREYSFLIVHSMLHLFGYDHMEEEERKQMEAKQREIMEQMGILRESN